MGFKFRLKTGFFETKNYDLLISKGKLMFSSSEPIEQLITIPEKDILNIILKYEKSLEIEIQTWEKVFHGVLGDKSDYEKLLGQLKDNINKKIICEYEGGN